MSHQGTYWVGLPFRLASKVAEEKLQFIIFWLAACVYVCFVFVVRLVKAVLAEYGIAGIITVASCYNIIQYVLLR